MITANSLSLPIWWKKMFSNWSLRFLLNPLSAKKIHWKKYKPGSQLRVWNHIVRHTQTIQDSQQVPGWGEMRAMLHSLTVQRSQTHKAAVALWVHEPFPLPSMPFSHGPYDEPLKESRPRPRITTSETPWGFQTCLLIKGKTGSPELTTLTQHLGSALVGTPIYTIIPWIS